MDGVWLLIAGVSLLVFFLLVLIVGVGLILYTRKKRRAALNPPLQQPSSSIEPVVFEPPPPPGPAAPMHDHFVPAAPAAFAGFSPESSAPTYTPEPIAPPGAFGAEPVAPPHSEPQHAFAPPPPAWQPPPVEPMVPPVQQWEAPHPEPHRSPEPPVASFPAEPRRPRTAEIPIPPPSTPAPQNAEGGWGALVGISGEVAGRTVPIDERGFYVGRDAAVAQVVIENPRISKRHVWVGVRGDAVVAVDQKSTNGTYLNRIGVRITETALKPGDTIILADDAARFQYQR